MYTYDDLYSAAEIGDDELVKTILEAQPELISEKDKYEFSILHGAVMSESEELIKFLIKNGADVNAKNDEGITPLHIVLYPEIAQILIAHGAVINAVSKNGDTPLHVMAAEGDQTLDVVELLLENGADKSIKDKQGKTAFDIAKSRDEEGLMEILKIN